MPELLGVNVAGSEPTEPLSDQPASSPVPPLNQSPSPKHPSRLPPFMEKLLILVVLVMIYLNGTVAGYYMGVKTGEKGQQDLQDTLAFYLTRKPIPSKIPAATSSIPSNWKTYTNNNLGVSFKYPATSSTFGNTPVQIEESISKVSIVASSSSQLEGNLLLSIDLIQNGDINSVYAKDKKEFSSLSPLEQVIINNYPAKKTYFQGMVAIAFYYILNDSQLYHIEVTNSPEIDQILSTFTVIGNGPTASCTPRPACLDATPRCLIAETSDMCPRATL